MLVFFVLLSRLNRRASDAVSIYSTRYECSIWLGIDTSKAKDPGKVEMLVKSMEDALQTRWEREMQSMQSRDGIISGTRSTERHSLSSVGSREHSGLDRGKCN